MVEDDLKDDKIQEGAEPGGLRSSCSRTRHVHPALVTWAGAGPPPPGNSCMARGYDETAK